MDGELGGGDLDEVDEHLEDLNARHQDWRWWKGVGSTGYYARRKLSSPPRVFSAGNLGDLEKLVADHEDPR
jgi:hypothetical protein